LTSRLDFIQSAPLQILHLFPHLFDQQLELDRCLRNLRDQRFGTERIGFAIEFLHQEIEALAARPAGPSTRSTSSRWVEQARQFFGNVDPRRENGDFLTDSFVVDHLHGVEQALPELSLNAACAAGMRGSTRAPTPACGPHFFQDHRRELFPLARPAGHEIVERLAGQRQASRDTQSRHRRLSSPKIPGQRSTSLTVSGAARGRTLRICVSKL
jgi:hypothetical protein